MTTVQIQLRIRRTTGGALRHPPRDTIDLDRLSPRARALAEAVAASLGGNTSFVWIETDGPRSQYRTQPVPDAYADPARDATPARDRWSAWDKYYANDPTDPHDYLERQAAKIPAGWHVVGPDPQTPVATTDRELTADQVVATISRFQPGTTMTARTWRSYVSRGRAPEPVRHVGRTPLWNPDDVLAWLHNRPGQGARTDL